MNVPEYRVKAAVNWGEMLWVPVSKFYTTKARPVILLGKCPVRSREIDSMSYNSGLFCVSITAANGMPKFEAGPQKSVQPYGQPYYLSFHRICASRALQENIRVEQK